MKKRLLILALALSMTLEPAAAVCGAEFSSGPGEKAVNEAAEEVFFSTDETAEAGIVPPAEETPVPDVQQQEQQDPDETLFFEDQQETDQNENGKVSDDAEPVNDTEIFTASEEEPPEVINDGEGEILSTSELFYRMTNGEITILGAKEGLQILEIPETLSGYPVTGIGERAFYESKMTEIKLPVGLKKIGAEAFAGCGGLVRMELPASVEEIGENAFASCQQLILICTAGSYAEKYAEENHLPYEIREKEKTDITKCTVTMAASAVCTGKALTPAAEVKDGDKVLVSGKDYTVEYRDNINPGTGTAVITGTGDYQGTLEKTFAITLAAPKLVSAKSASYCSVKVTWRAVPGAESYILYYKESTGKSWKKVKTGIKATSYIHKSSKSFPLVTGKKYTYTVRAAAGKTTSGYDKAGKTAAPVLAAVKLGTVKSAAYNKLKITWTKVAGASGYYIYRKSGKSWKRIGTAKASASSYTHTGSTKFPIKTGATYTYSVKAYRKTGKTVSLSGGSKTGIKGKAVPNKAVLTNVECVGDGKITIRWKKAAGATGYLICRKDAKGKWKQVANVKGANMIGYTHVSSKSYPIVTGKTYTYTVRSYTTVGNTKGIYDTKGRTVKAVSAAAAAEASALRNAKKIIAQITTPKMSNSQKLKACFDWVISKPYVTRRKFVNVAGWPATYANDHFVLGGGNCHSDASAFAYMAKALGYKNVYVCTDSDGTRGLAHGWAEVNGLVYDPLFAEAKGYYRYFGVSYRTYELRPILHIAI